MLEVSKKIVLKCDAFLCDFEKSYTEEEFNAIMLFDEERLTETEKYLVSGGGMFARQIREKILIQQGQCPLCVARKEAAPEKPHKGGWLRKDIHKFRRGLV